MTIALNRISNANNLSNEDDKMFYRWLCSFIVVFIFIFTCGCTPFTTSWQKTTNSSSASTTTNLEEDIEIEPNLQIISAQVGLLMSGVAGTQDGAYELRSYYDGTADIIYYDYKTQQAVFYHRTLTCNMMSQVPHLYLQLLEECFRPPVMISFLQ